MRVLITGGAGFIGANLARRLVVRDHQVTILDDLSTGFEQNVSGLDVSLEIGSILDTAKLQKLTSHADAVVHLAARSSVPRSIDDPVATHTANATGTLNVLEAARLHGGQHVIIASSSSVYGANPELPKRESSATRPLSPYAASKLAAESYALSYQSSFALPTLALRFFNVFGPLQPAGHSYAAVIPAFVNAALRSEKITVNGDGHHSRDFTNVSTVCATIMDALERQVTCSDPVNLAFGSRIELLEVLSLLTEHIDKPLVVEHGPPRTGDVAHSQADCSLLRTLFPAIEPMPFVNGLLETIEWMRNEIAQDVHESGQAKAGT